VFVLPTHATGVLGTAAQWDIPLNGDGSSRSGDVAVVGAYLSPVCQPITLLVCETALASGGGVWWSTPGLR